MTNEASSTGMPETPQGSTGPGSSGPTGSAYPGGSATPSTVPMGDNSTTAGLVAQARSSDEHFLFGDDRAVVNPPNWNNQKSTQLYNGATVNNDPSTAESTGQDWMGHAGELEQIADDLYNAITELGAVWVGQGAGAAQGALVSIATSGSQAGAAARSMADRMSAQAVAAAEVKKMPPPKEFDQAQATKAMLAGGPAAMAADMKAQHEAAREVKQEQVRYFNAYTAAMSDIDGSTPSFGPDSLGLKPIAGTGAGGAGSVGSVGAPAAAGGQVNTAALGGPSVTPTGPSAPVPGGIGGPAPAAPSVDAAASSVDVDAAQTSSAGLAASASTGAAAPTPAPAPTTAAPSGPSGLGAALGAGAIGGGLGLAGGKLAEGRHSGRTRDEEGEVDEAGEGEERNDEETEVAAQQSSIAPVNPASSSLISGGGTIGGSAQAGMAGAGAAPMGGGAAGAGRGGDEEHTHASFLIEPDPDDVFGAGEATPPPVIGEWIDED